MLINGSADMGTSSETFFSVLCYFLRVIFEVTYVGLVHYGFVTLRRNHSHLILEHVLHNDHFTPKIVSNIAIFLKNINAKDIFGDHAIQGWWVNGVQSIIITYLGSIFQLCGT